VRVGPLFKSSWEGRTEDEIPSYGSLVLGHGMCLNLLWKQKVYCCSLRKLRAYSGMVRTTSHDYGNTVSREIFDEHNASSWDSSLYTASSLFRSGSSADVRHLLPAFDRKCRRKASARVKLCPQPPTIAHLPSAPQTCCFARTVWRSLIWRVFSSGRRNVL
jgi:hypothetical protein